MNFVERKKLHKLVSLIYIKPTLIIPILSSLSWIKR